MERSTKQRQVIEEVLARTDRPLSPQELLGEAQRESPRLGIATVYRALRDGQDAGTIRTVEVPGGATRYELAHHGHHHHFHCVVCKKVYEVEGCPGNLADLAPAGFEVSSHEILLSGTCRDCLALRRR